MNILTANGTVEWWGLVVVFLGCILAGYIDAIAGGGGLIQVPMFMLAGLPLHAVIGTNKIASAMGTSFVAVRFARQGFMKWRLCVPCIVAAFLGAQIGARCSLMASEEVLRVVMLAVIPVVGFYVLRHKELGAEKDPWSQRKTLVLCCCIALAVGFYDGFYGPGTGTFLMLLLTGLGHLNLNSAAGVTKCVNLTTNLSSLVVFALSGTCVWVIGIVGGLGNLLGGYFGSGQFTQQGAAIVRPIMLVVLCLFALRLILEMAGIA